MLKMYSYFSNPNMGNNYNTYIKQTHYFCFFGAIEFKKEPHNCVRLPSHNLL